MMAMQQQQDTTILLVEDEVLIAMSTAQDIEQFGYKVVTAHSGEEAVETANGNSQIGLILMDIDLGRGIDGAEAARRILAARHIPIVFLTSHREEEYINRIKEITRYGYVIKNSGDFVLKSSIEMAFELFQEHEKARKSEQKYRILFQNIQAGVIVHDAGTHIMTCNAKAQEILGLNEERMLGKSARDSDWRFLNEDGTFMPVEAYPAIRVANTKLPIRDQIGGIYRSHSDDVVWVMVNADPMFDLSGEIEQIIVTLTDITERKKSEEALRKSEEKFQKAFQSAPVTMSISTMEEGVMLDVNDEFLTLTEYSRAEVIGHKGSDLGLWDIASRDAVISELKQNRSIRDKEVVIISKTGKKIPIQLYADTINLNGQACLIVTGYDLTKRKKAEQALKENEETLLLVLENIPLAVFLHNLEGELFLVNETSVQYTGYDRSELLSMTVADLDHDSVTRDDRTRIWKQLQYGGHQRFISQHFRKDGSDYPAEIHVTAMTLRGEPLILGLAEDITERKKAEEELKLYELITAAVNDAMSFVDTNYIYRTVNDSYSRLSGLSREDIIGKTPAEVVGRDIFEQSIKPRLDRCFSGKEVHYQLWADSPVKGKRYMDMHYYPLFAEDGSVLGAVSQGHDMTVERTLQDQLEAAEKDWRDSFDSLEDVMLIINKDFTVEKINQNGLELLGLPNEQAAGKKCYELIHRSDQPRDTCPFLKSMKSGHVESAEIYEAHFDRHFSMKSSPIFNEAGEIVKFVALMRDITDLKLLQQKLQAANDAKDTFFSIIAHDLKNPAITFQIGTRMLKKHLKQSDDMFAGILH